MVNKKKLMTLLVIIILVLLLFLIFKIVHYKNIKTGNNISNKTLKEVEDYILNIGSYNAEIDVEVKSNKNTNKYILKQKYASPNNAYQEVIEPKNIEGLTVKYDGTNLEISNSKLSLSTIYENYTYIADNVLWLSDFIENYKSNGGVINEENNIIVMETKCDKNRYATVKKLYIDRSANKITKLIIEDENRENRIYITYNKIEIGSFNNKNMMAFNVRLISKKDV